MQADLNRCLTGGRGAQAACRRVAKYATTKCQVRLHAPSMVGFAGRAPSSGLAGGPDYVFRLTPDGKVGGWCAALRHVSHLIAPEKGGCPIYKGRSCVENCPFPGTAEKQSRYVVGEIVFEDLHALTEVLENAFGKGSVERSANGKNTLTAIDYHGESRDTEIGKVAAVVRRRHVGGSSNDLPVKQQPDGTYRLIVSEYDESYIPGKLKWGGKAGGESVEGRFAQLYGANVLNKKLKPLGYTLTTTTEADGTLRIRASHKGTTFYGLHGRRKRVIGQRAGV